MLCYAMLCEGVPDKLIGCPKTLECYHVCIASMSMFLRTGYIRVSIRVRVSAGVDQGLGLVFRVRVSVRVTVRVVRVRVIIRVRAE